MVVNDNSYSWIYCEKCNKKLLKRKSNGVFVFKFGRTQEQQNMIDLEIFGSIKMKCFRKTCGYINIINLFPS